MSEVSGCKPMQAIDWRPGQLGACVYLFVSGQIDAFNERRHKNVEHNPRRSRTIGLASFGTLVIGNVHYKCPCKFKSELASGSRFIEKTTCHTGTAGADLAYTSLLMSNELGYRPYP